MSTDDAAVEAVMRVHRWAGWNASGTAPACSCGWQGVASYLPSPMKPEDEWAEHVAREAVTALTDRHRADVDAAEKRGAVKALREYRQAILDNRASEVQTALDIAHDIPEWIACFIEPDRIEAGQ